MARETKSNPPLAFTHKRPRKTVGGECAEMKVKIWLCVLKCYFSRARHSHQFDSWVSHPVCMCPRFRIINWVRAFNTSWITAIKSLF